LAHVINQPLGHAIIFHMFVTISSSIVHIFIYDLHVTNKMHYPDLTMQHVMWTNQFLF